MHTYTSWLYLYGGFQVPNCDMQTNLVCKIILLLQVMNTTILLLALFCNYLFSLGLVCPSAASGASASSGSSNAIANGSNAFALLTFKAMLHDPAGLLESWNTSNHLCSWYGVRCGGYRHGELRVVVLELNSCGLAGRISPSLGNLSFLSMLDLGSNQLHGQIPQELGNLGRLQVLNLTGNDLNGHIPAALGGCLELRKMALGRNQLQGEIPPQILQSMRKLTVLDVRYNSLSGEIPLSSSSVMMNLSLSLTHLLLDNNMLSGEIPSALGNLSTLRVLSLENNLLSGGIPSSLGWLSISQLSLGFNNFSGNLPPSIWNMSSLTKLEAFGNKLAGEIPQDAFNTLSHLELLHIYDNMFYGPVPTSLENSSNLAHIDFHKNLLTGTIPPIFGGMKNLQCLMLFSNHLKAEQPEDWKFMSTLSNCSSLQYLQIGDNKFRGEFPTSVSNLPTSIRKFFMRETEISGSIPAGIGNLVNLEALDLENGKLIGSLPSTFGLLKNLQGLFLSGNKLTGKIPRTLGNLTRMNKLYLASNNFTGNIPTSLGNMKSLEALNLSHNQLTGTIPKELASIVTLSGEFDLSHNHLEGSIPFEFGNLQNLVEFNAESNRLSGEIPASFGDCRVLQFLYLQNNLLQGSIPQLSSGLKGLQRLDLSNNNLSGQIPRFLQDSRSISYLNLSFNHLVGDVPVVGIFSNASAISIQGNRYLCGGIHELHLPPCSFPSKSKYLVKVVVSLVTTVCVFLLVLLIFALYKRKSAKSPMKSSSFRGHTMITYADLVKATDGFAIANLIGAGSHGSVFKATLGDDGGNFANHVAVKVLNLQTQGAAKSFTKECEAIRNLRHRNLVKIISVCSSIDFRGNDFKAIVLDFMPNGSLEDWLHPQGNNGTNPRLLSLTQRVNIAFDVASALDYLHHYSVTPVIHCDLKPSNVLLDEDMVAHLGDFGIAQIITEDSSCKTNSTSSLGLKGTVGYSAPEYGAGNRVSANGDIYSFGVVLLEMMTGKRPTDVIFNNGLSLHKLVEMALPDGVMDIVDKNMAADQDGNGALHCSWIASEPKKWEIECITCLLKLGLVCCEELPSSRLSAKEIIKELGVIRESLTAQNT